jgi:hypothetical protein
MTEPTAPPRRRRRNSVFITFDERNVLTLLLTTARVLRSQIRGTPHMTAQDMIDSNLLTEVLIPFDQPEDKPI